MDYPEIKRTFLNILNRTDVSGEEADSLLRFGINEVGRVLNATWQQKCYSFEASEVPGLITTTSEGTTSTTVLPIVISIQGNLVSYNNYANVTITVSGNTAQYTVEKTEGSVEASVTSAARFDLTPPSDFESLRRIFVNGRPISRVSNMKCDGFLILGDKITVQSSIGFDPKDEFTVEYFALLDFDDSIKTFIDDAIIYSSLVFASDIYVDARVDRFQSKLNSALSQIQTSNYEKDAIGFLSIQPLGDI